MCWGKLSRHPGRAHAWPLCGPWPRPHLAASKLVELRSSVDLVAMPHQPLAWLATGKCAHARTRVKAGTTVSLRSHRWQSSGRFASKMVGWHWPERAVKTWSIPEEQVLERSQCQVVIHSPTRRFALAPLARLAQPVARPAWWPYTTVALHQSDGKARSGKWHEEASAWGSSPSRLCVLGRSLSHANDQESHPLPVPAAARRCGGRRPVIRC
jgi:hypothetical protein